MANFGFLLLNVIRCRPLIMCLTGKPGEEAGGAGGRLLQRAELQGGGSLGTGGLGFGERMGRGPSSHPLLLDLPGLPVMILVPAGLCCSWWGCRTRT